MIDQEAVEALTVMIAFLTFAPALFLFLPVGQCSECAHCRRERLGEARRVVCPLCKQMIDPNETHTH